MPRLSKASAAVNPPIPAPTTTTFFDVLMGGFAPGSDRCGAYQRIAKLQGAFQIAAARSILTRRPQIFRETRPDIRGKKLFDAHPAARQVLLVEIREQRLQRRSASFD